MINRNRDESGAVAVVVAIFAVVVMIAAAFAVDLGNGYATKRQLSVAADAAAIAGAQELAKVIPIGTNTCDGEGWLSAAQAGAADLNSAPEPAELDSVSVNCDNWPSFVEVEVRNSRTISTYFGQFAGVNDLDPANFASAIVFSPDRVTGLRPFAACEGDLISPTNPGASAPFVVSISKSNAVCGNTVVGNWGYVNFLDQTGNGSFNIAGTLAYNPSVACTSSNATPSGGQAGCQTDWTADGYDGPVGFPNEILTTGGIRGNTGVANTASFKSALRDLVGETISLPVSNLMQGTGSTALHNVVGVVTVQVCSVNHFKDGKTLGSGATACGTPEPTAADIGYANWEPLSTSDQEAVLWVMPTVYETGEVNVTPGSFGSGDFGTRGVKLYR